MAGLSRLSILIVDDNAQMRSILGTVLSALGVRDRHFAPDGLRGLEAMSSVRPDIVFCDYEMPLLNGLDFLSNVRQLPEPLCFTPVIMITGHSDLPRLNEARDRGVTEFLTKPVAASAIARRLEAVILRPRQFIHAPVYFGPDRRRRVDPFRASLSRRSSDSRDTIEN